MHFRDLATRVGADGMVTPGEILELRQGAWSDGQIAPEEAEAIFQLNDQLHDAPAEWSDFFVEALGEFIVNGIEPKGYVSDTNADWLIGRIDHNGRVDSLTELELLAKVFEKALSVPERLRVYALAQLEQAVLTGSGPTRAGGGLEPGRITPAEVALLRRMIFASASDRPAGVSRREAEMLFRIKDETLGADNAPEWQQLFVQGVANYLMGFAGREPLSRERATELESFMKTEAKGIGSFFARMARSDVDNAFGKVFGRKQPARDLDAEVADAARLTSEEDTWLQGMIDANDQIDAMDKALLAFLAES